MIEHDVPSGLVARIPTPSVGDPRLARLSLNQRTTAEWTLAEAISGALAAGIGALGVWREPLAEVGVDVGARMLADAGMRVSSLCRGGFFTDPAHFDDALDANRIALDECVAIGAPTLVLVAGGLPHGSRDLVGARSRATEAIARLAPEAHDRGLTLSIEPMHPLFAADRGVVSTLEQALDIAEQFAVEDVGVVVDTYHLWWDPTLLTQIARAGARVASYQLGDWITPLAADTLLSRGMMGDGHIDFGPITAAVAAAGYTGDVEVEIFNADIWKARCADTLATVARRYVELVQPHL